MGGGNGPIDPTGGIGGASPVDSVDGAEAIEDVQGTSAAEAAAPISEIASAQPLPNASAIDRITADFQAGHIDRQAAVDAIIEAVIPPHAQGASRAELKEIMLDLAEHDVYLQRLIARLG